MPLDLKRGIVRILAADGVATSGTGFILSEKGIIVTCSHVVQAEKLQVRGYPRPESVEIVFRANGEKAAARLLPQAWRAADAEDVAFLQLEGLMPEGVVPLPLGSSDGAAGHQFQSFGFPDQSPEEGLYGEGQLIEQTSILGMKVWQVKSSEITPGFSGGPVFDEQARHVVGMVTSIAAPDKFGRLSETAFVTPAETLFSIYPAIAASDVRPYMGLAPFSEKDAEFFFGRKRLVEGLEEALRSRPRFLLVMGPSGSGKSSVVQAGLIPRLRKGSVPGSDRWGIIVARPADRPFENLERAGLRGAYAGLADAVRSWMERNPDQEKLLLILDQFEEFLVTCPPDLSQRLWEGLKGLLDSDIELTVMAVMRDDFYSRFAADAPPAVLAWTQHGFFQVGSELGKEELQEIISEPARRVGLRLEEGLADVIINDVLESSREGGGKVGRSTVLPLLEFALTQLWERREQGVLTHQAYQAVGGVTGSLTLWADQVCHSLEREGLGPVARRLLTDLVNLGYEGQRLPDSRRQRRLADLVHDQEDEKEKEAVRKVVQRLADARLVTTSLDKGEESVQIIHDSLIREWARLQRWLKKDRAFLSWKREMEWDSREWRETSPEPSGRDDGRLLRGRKLEEAERWQKERWRDLGEGEQEFVQASLGLREREREEEERARADKERTRKRIIQGVVVFSIFSLALAGLAYDQMLEANDRKEEALARSLAAQSEQMRGVAGALNDSILLAVESLKHKETQEGFAALRNSYFLHPRLIAQLNSDNSRETLDFSFDGSMAAIDNDSSIRLLNASTDPLNSFGSPSRETLAFSFDGSMVAIATDGSIGLFDARTGVESKRLKHNGPVYSINFSPDGFMLAVGSDDIAYILDIHTQKIRAFNCDGLVHSVIISPSGIRLAAEVYNDTGTFGTLMWDINRGVELLKLYDHKLYGFKEDPRFPPHKYDKLVTLTENTVHTWLSETGKMMRNYTHDEWYYDNPTTFDFLNGVDRALSSNGDFLAVQTDNLIQIFDLYSLRKRLLSTILLDYTSKANALDFSPDSSKIVTIGQDTVQLWDVKTGKELLRMEGIGSEMALSPDLRTFAARDKGEELVRLWDFGTEKNGIFVHNGPVHSVDFNLEGTQLVTTSEGSLGLTAAYLWNLQTGGEIFLSDTVQGMEFIHDKSKIAIVSSGSAFDEESSIELFDMRNGTHLKPIKGIWLGRINFLPSGNEIAEFGGEGIVRLWDIQKDEKMLSWRYEGKLMESSFSPDGSKLATLDGDSMPMLWDIQKGEKLPGLNHYGKVKVFAFSEDGTVLATFGNDNMIRLWDIETSKELFNITHNDTVTELTFSPKGSELAIIGGDEVRLIDYKKRKDLPKPQHDGLVQKVTFSSNDNKLAMISGNVIQLIDIETGKKLQRVEHKSQVKDVAFSPNGEMLASASDDKTARIWLLNSTEMIENACSRITWNMTIEQWQRFMDDPVSDCITCPANGTFDRNSIWPWGRRECQPCGGSLG